MATIHLPKLFIENSVFDSTNTSVNLEAEPTAATVLLRHAIMSRQSIIIGVAVVLLGTCGQVLAKQSCERLASLKLPDTTITLAESIAAGTFVSPTPIGQESAPVSFKELRLLPSHRYDPAHQGFGH